MSDFAATYRFLSPNPPSHIHLNTTNPLAPVEAPGHPSLIHPPEHSVTVAWSGWFGLPDESDTGAVDLDRRAWSGPGRAHLDAMLAASLPRFAAASAALWLRPHARHVLSDAPSCVAFLRDHDPARAAGTLAILLDLDLVLTPATAARRADLAERLVSGLAPTGALAAIAMPPAEWDGSIGALAASLAPEAHRLMREA